MILRSQPNILQEITTLIVKTDQIHLYLLIYEINYSFSKWKTRHTNKSKCLIKQIPKLNSDQNSQQYELLQTLLLTAHIVLIQTKSKSTKIFFQQNQRTKANLFKMLSKRQVNKINHINQVIMPTPSSSNSTHKR